MARQMHHHAGALAFNRFNPDLPAGLAHKTIHHRQPQASTGTNGFGGEKRLEGLGDDRRAHATAGVGNTDAQVFAGRNTVVRVVTLGERSICGFNDDVPAIGHRITGIQAQVQQRAFQLGMVDQCWPQIILGDHFDVYFRADRARDHFFHVMNQHVYVGHSRRQGLAPGKGQQPVSQ